jgi:hypothetical protein
MTYCDEITALMKEGFILEQCCRHDPDKPDDLDTKAEDHAADSVR